VAIALTCAGDHVLIRYGRDLVTGELWEDWPTPPADSDGVARPKTWREYFDDSDTPRSVVLECFACRPVFRDGVTIGHVRAVLDHLRLGGPPELHLTCAKFHDAYRRLRQRHALDFP
jgi:hypothetical protein